MQSGEKKELRGSSRKAGTFTSLYRGGGNIDSFSLGGGQDSEVKDNKSPSENSLLRSLSKVSPNVEEKGFNFLLSPPPNDRSQTNPVKKKEPISDFNMASRRPVKHLDKSRSAGPKIRISSPKKDLKSQKEAIKAQFKGHDHQAFGIGWIHRVLKVNTFFLMVILVLLGIVVYLLLSPLRCFCMM